MENININDNVNDTEDIVFPETIIGIGGAGKKLVFSLLSKKWILEEMLRPVEGNAKNYRAITVDTAVAEHGKNLAIRQNILNNINIVRNNLGKNSRNVPNNLDVDCQLLTKDIPLLGEADIMGQEVVTNIKKTGVKYWWFYSPDIGYNLANQLKSKENFNNLNFSGGVIRRRALGKAILHKAISEGRTNIGLTRGGKVAMIVGLGGGTGSGTFIDYAKKLKERSPPIDITLFAVLPTSSERDKEQANGFASLCELEYMKMTGELNKLFKHIILLPMEPTMYRDDDHLVISLMEEFHDTFAYTFLSYFNIKDNVPMDGYPYAPFIMASSCIIRYNVESNIEIIDNLNSALLSKIEGLKIEKDINSTIGDFLKENKDKDKDKENKDRVDEYKLDHEDNKWLSSRLTDIKNLLFTNYSDREKLQSFVQAGYQCFNIFGEAIRRGEDKVKSDNIIKKVEYIKAEIEMAKIQNPRTEIDTPMRDLVNTEPLIINDMAKLFSNINDIRDHKEKKIINEIIKKEGPYPESKIWISNTIDNIEAESSQIEKNKEQSNRDLEDYREKTGSKITEAKTKIINNIKSDVEKLQKIESKDYKEEIKLKSERLNSELTNYVNDINRRGTDQLGAISINNIERTLEDFTESIKYIDNTFNKNVILSSVGNIKDYRMASLIVSGGTPLTDRFLKIFGVETGTVERIRRAEEDKRMFAIMIRDSNIFDIKKDDSIAVIFKYDTDNILNKRIDTIMEDIILKLNNITKLHFNSEMSDDQKDIIRNIIKLNNLDNGLEDVLKDIIKYNNTLVEYEDKISRHNVDLDSIKKRNRYLTALYTLYTTIYAENGKIDEYRKNIDIFKYNLDEFGKFFTETHIRSQYDDRYVFQIEPKKESNVIGRNNIKAFLEAEKDEEKNLLSKANIIIDGKLFSSKYHNLANQCIEYDSDRWSVGSIVFCTTSLKNIIIDKKSDISGLFRITNIKKIGNITLNIGDTWDLGLTLLVTGTFLDNIADIADPTKGYYASYVKIKNDMKELIFLHHAYNLDKGYFIDRTIIPLEEEDNKKLFASNDGDAIIKKIKSHQKIVPYAIQLLENNSAKSNSIVQLTDNIDN